MMATLHMLHISNNAVSHHEVLRDIYWAVLRRAPSHTVQHVRK